MSKRVVTSIVYVAVFLGLLAMKWLIPGGWGVFGFDVLFCAVSIIGCIELLNAVKDVSFPQRVIAIAFCSVIVPLYVVVQMTAGDGFLAIGCCGCLYAIILAALNVFHHGESTVRGTMVCFMAMLYCGVLSCMLSAINHLNENSLAAIILLFLTVVFTDTGAYLIGSAFKKWVPLKLAPRLSPNKTVIGGIGGLIGGMVGAVAAYYIQYGLSLVPDFGMPLVYTSEHIPAVVSFLLIGFVTAIFAQVGDLFESAIKRECNIKDMGKMLPGHGGILDRFDSMLFSSVIVLFSFGILIL